VGPRLEDFLLATQAAPELAEAHASLGTYWILREAPEGALEAFNQALAINPDFALAYNGRGCAYFGQGEFEKAAQNFRMASQLSPMVALTEVNQGFASAYASRLITLANMEQQPGMSLESLPQQNQAQFQARQQELVKNIPGQNFWNKMRVFDRLPAAEQKTFINTHGLAEVQTAVSHVIEHELLEQHKWHQEGLNQNRVIGSVAQSQFWLGVVKQGVSVTLTGIGTTKDLYEAGKLENWLQGTGALKAERTLDRAAATSLIENPLTKRLIDVIPSSPTALGVAGAIAKTAINKVDLHLTDRQGAAMITQTHALDMSRFHAKRAQGLLASFPRSPEIGATKALSQPSSSIPGYYISENRPLTDLGSLASTLNKQISPGTSGAPRNALIVDQAPFRTSLLQSELGKYGFQTTAISSGADVQRMAGQWRSDAIVGIEGSDLLKRTQYPFFPPGGGGGGAAAGNRIPHPFAVLPKKFDQWGWGKPFIPTSPAIMPGGISTEELARTFVDKGNWPVLTAFGLFYTLAPRLMAQNKGE